MLGICFKTPQPSPSLYSKKIAVEGGTDKGRYIMLLTDVYEGVITLL